MPIINMVYKKKKWWKPWANTLAYYPLTSDLVDKMWNTTLPITWTKQSVGYLFNVWDENGYISNTSNAKFLSCWENYQGSSYSVADGVGLAWYVAYSYKQTNSSFKNKFNYNNGNSWQNIVAYSMPSGWHLVSLWWDGTTYTVYINGSLIGTKNDTRAVSNCSIGNRSNLILSDYILEDRVRTAQEVADYYNQTKANYWL